MLFVCVRMREVKRVGVEGEFVEWIGRKEKGRVWKC